MQSENQKKVKEAPLVIGEVNFACERDLFCPRNNPAGYIHYGTAMNRAVMELIVPYLPEFVTTKDTVYQMPPGSPAFRTLVSSSFADRFDFNQTVTMNSIYSVLTVLSLNAKAVGISGLDSSALSFVATHSTSAWTNVGLNLQNDNNLHLLVVSGSIEEATTAGTSVLEAVDHYNWLFDNADSITNSKLVTVFLLENSTQLTAFPQREHANISIVFAFAHNLAAGIRCGVAVTKDAKTLSMLVSNAFFFPFSSVCQVAALTGKEVQEGSFDDLAETITKMITITEDIQTLNKENIIFGTGGSAVLDSLGRILFQSGDKLALDAPFYSGFVGDFSRSGIQLCYIEYFDEDEIVSFNSKAGEKSIQCKAKTDFRRVKNTLKLRAQRAYEDGCRGYVICNPHNPSGRLYDPQEILDLCEWVMKLNNNGADNEGSDAFHLIFDELYSHSIYDPYRAFQSALTFSQKSQYIHVVRGFAKDFGLCGLKTGYGFTSNERVLALTRSWVKIMRPQRVNAWVLNTMLLKTNYGQDIYSKNQELLSTAMKRITDALDKAKISYLLPHAGVFIMVNLSDELRANPTENEYTLWKNLVQMKHLNITPGKIFGYKEQGWYRLCPFTPVEIIDEGFQRLSTFINQEFR